MADAPPLHVSLLAVPGTLALPIAGLYEVLTAFPVVAEFYDGVPASPPFAVEIVGSARMDMSAASGLPIRIQRSIDEIPRTDIAIIPTMAVEEPWEPGRFPEIVDWMRRMHDGGAVLCSACTGLLVLAETGVLNGHQATTHWAVGPSVRRCFPEVDLRLKEVLVTAGDRDELVMSGGASSWQDLVLYLIGRFVSPTASRAIAKFELLEQHSEGQAPYLPFLPQTRHGDSMVLDVQEWLTTHYAVAHPVTEAARRAGLSLRAFERRFKHATGLSPLRYIQRVRVEEAKRRLERTDVPIDQISWEVGYEDAAAFRRLFKRIARVPPGQYRKKFGAPTGSRRRCSRG